MYNRVHTFVVLLIFFTLGFIREQIILNTQMFSEKRADNASSAKLIDWEVSYIAFTILCKGRHKILLKIHHTTKKTSSRHKYSAHNGSP